MKQIQAILIGAGSRGAKAYAPYALQHPDRLRFVAVAEPIEIRRGSFCRDHGIARENAFESYEELLSSNITADVAFVCTQDNTHLPVALMALDHGYNLVLEKPISNNLESCEAIVTKAQEKQLNLVVCHVLRYTSFFGKIKSILDSGELGDLMSITLNENVGYYHSAHSYVRGNWRNEAESSPMILAKSCHDMDLLYWLAGSPCKKVSSFGGRKFFRKENAPAGSTARCLDGCAIKAECPFDAEKIYMDPEQTGWPVNVITEDLSPEGRIAALKSGPYGRCVFQCDNDVVDHQAVNVEYENGVIANFSMNSLSAEICRTISVYGTKGQLWGTMEANVLNKQLFGRELEVIHTQSPGKSEYAHGGGDYGLMEYVYGIFSNEASAAPKQSDAIISHRICFAAEQSRKKNVVFTF